MRRVFSLCLVLLLGAVGRCSEAQWSLNGSGDWLNSLNWLGPVPNGAGDTARFFAGHPTTNAIVALDAPITVGALLSSNAFQITVDAADPIANPFTFDSGDVSPAALDVLQANGRVRFDTSLVVSEAGLHVNTAAVSNRVQFDRSVSGAGEIVKSGAGTLQLNADNSNWTGPLSINAGVVEVNHSLGLGALDSETIVDGGVLRFTQPILKQLDLRSGRIVAAHALNGDVTMHSGELTFAYTGPHLGDVTSHGGRITVEAAANTTLLGELNLTGGSTTELAGGAQRTLNLNGGGSGQGDIFVSGRSLVKVNNVGVHYDGALNVAGRIDFNAPSSVKSLYVDYADNGQGYVSGDGSLQVAEPIVLRRGAIAFDYPAVGLDTSMPIHKIGMTGARLAPGDAFAGDVIVEEGSLWINNLGLGTAAGVTIVRERRADLLMDSGDDDETIRLENSTGFAYRGGIRLAGGYAAGEIHLGNQGSTIGFTDGSQIYFQYAGKFSGNALQLVGNGSLSLLGNTHTYTGATTIGGNDYGSGSTLELRELGALRSTSGIVVNHGGLLRLNNREEFRSTPNEDRVGDDIPITLRGGSVLLEGYNGVYVNEVLGNVLAERGASSIGVDPNVPDTILSLAGVQRANHATLDFRGAINVDPYGESPLVTIDDAPATQNGIFGAWATVDQSDFASYSPDAGVHGLRDTVLRPAKISGAGPNAHVQSYAAQTLTQDATIATLVATADVDLNGHKLTLGQGGAILFSHPDHFGIKNGELTSGGNELILHGVGSTSWVQDVLVTASIVDNAAGPVAFIKAGGSVVTLAAHNTYTGGTTVNEGVLRIAQADALPVGGSLTLDGGVLQLMFPAGPEQSELVLDEFQLLNQSGAMMNVDGPAVAIRATSYQLESGNLSVPFAGDGSVTKTSPARLILYSDNPQFSGSFEIADGVVVADVLGAQGDPLVQPFGVGQVVVQPNGILAHSSTPLNTLVNSLDAHLVLNGGELALGHIDTSRPAAFSGEIDVTANSRMSLYDADDGTTFGSGKAVMLVDSELTLRDNVTLRTTGPGEFLFNGAMRVGNVARIEAVDNLTRLWGVITSNHANASLDLSGPGRFSLENSVHARQGEKLSITINEEVVPLAITVFNHFARGGGVLLNPLEISDGGRLRPGDDVGTLRVESNVTWGAGGVYEWEINDADTAGGWDLLKASASLSLTATSERPFVIQLLPLAGAGSPVDGFDPFVSYEWTIVESHGLSLALDALLLDVSAFRGAFGDLPLGEFQLSLGTDKLAITYLAASCLNGETTPCDGVVDLADLNAVRNHFGETGAPGLPGDTYPFDGLVDLGDLNAVRNNFGAGVTPVPEPATSALLFVCLVTACGVQLARRSFRS